MKRAFVAVAVMVTAALSGGIAQAAWQSAAGSGNAQAKATSVSAGNTPSASVNGSSVTVTWSASTLAGGSAVSGYQVKRYTAVGDVLQTIGAGCAGTIAALTCIETGVAVGAWKYSVTPLRSNWTGAESAKSNTVTVAAADTAAPTATITFPVNGASYNATGFNAGCTPNTSNVCGTASDATGVATVRVSVQQGTGNYWDGTAFSSAIEIFTNATLTSPNATSTDWRLPLSLSTETNYTVRVRTVDTVTPAANTQVTGYAATSTFTYDNTAATLAITSMTVGTGQSVVTSGTSNVTSGITLVLCKENVWPCAADKVAATPTVTFNGTNWTATSGNLNKIQVWGRATHTDAAGNTGTSNVAGPVTP